jgi:uncharacterized protein YaeQ
VGEEVAVLETPEERSDGRVLELVCRREAFAHLLRGRGPGLPEEVDDGLLQLGERSVTHRHVTDCNSGITRCQAGAHASPFRARQRLRQNRYTGVLALTATLYNFDVELADNDRGVYESLALRVARHPSESEEHLLARLLAYLLEYTDGIAFSRGVSDPDEPAIAVRDLTGAIRSWIDIGTPDAARLHKASKAAARVAVYTHKDPAQFLRQLGGEKIHREKALELYAIDRRLIGDLVARLERRVAFSLSITDRELYLSIGDDNLTGHVTALTRGA